MQQITLQLSDGIIAKFAQMGVAGEALLKNRLVDIIEQSVNEEVWLLQLAKEGEASGYLSEEESLALTQKMLNARD